ncbi:MAG: cellulase family glycosylhydrolase [Bdellovibrio sp.]|nr:cellulase family glycosylhydrolase [Bdellovibrio sp.]
MFGDKKIIWLTLILAFFVPSARALNQKIDLWKNKTQLRGVNIIQTYVTVFDRGTKGRGPLGSPFTLNDFKEMAALGANYVNISHAGPFTVEPPFKIDESVLMNLDNLLKMIKEADMFAVISIRSGPGRSEFTFVLGEDKTSDPLEGWFPAQLYNDTVWIDQSARSAWADMWLTVAKRYKDNPIVVGYDLMVEPNANEIFFKIYEGEKFYKKYRDTGYDWNSWYPTLVQAIRKVDAKTPILLQSMGHAHVNWMPFLQPSTDPNIVYTIHNYEPFSFTHQEGTKNHYPGIFDINNDSKAEKVDRAMLNNALTPFDLFLQARKGSMGAVNEFGVHRNAPGADIYISDMISLFEERGWNHALWLWYPVHFIKHRPAGDIHFDIRFGDNYANTKPLPNPVQSVIMKNWKRNSARPSNTKF